MQFEFKKIYTVYLLTEKYWRNGYADINREGFHQLLVLIPGDYYRCVGMLIQHIGWFTFELSSL